MSQSTQQQATLSGALFRTTSSGRAASQDHTVSISPSLADGRPVSRDQARGPPVVPGSEGVAHRFGHLPVPLAPLGGARQQLGDLLGSRLMEAGLQQVGKEMMIAIPAAIVVQGHDKEVAPLQPLEHLLAVRTAPGDGVAERAGEPGEDRGLEQEGLDLLRLAREHLLDQEVQDEAVGAREGPDEAIHILPSPHGKGRHLQPGDPALGPLVERRHLLGREDEPHRLAEEGGRFVRREPEVVGADLNHLPPRSQPGDGNRWIGAGGDDQMEVGRQVFQEKGQGAVDRR